MEHIYRGILFIFDRHHLEHAGFICAKAQSCVVVGGSRSGGDRNVIKFPMLLLFCIFGFSLVIAFCLIYSFLSLG